MSAIRGDAIAVGPVQTLRAATLDAQDSPNRSRAPGPARGSRAVGCPPRPRRPRGRPHVSGTRRPDRQHRGVAVPARGPGRLQQAVDEHRPGPATGPALQQHVIPVATTRGAVGVREDDVVVLGEETDGGRGVRVGQRAHRGRRPARRRPPSGTAATAASSRVDDLAQPGQPAPRLDVPDARRPERAQVAEHEVVQGSRRATRPSHASTVVITAADEALQSPRGVGCTHGTQ